MTHTPATTPTDDTAVSGALDGEVGGSTRPRVDFWFDPICPWAWITSRWIVEVADQRDIDVHWHVMSLAYLNHGRDLDTSYQQKMDKSWGPVRVVAAAIQQTGPDRPEIAGELYTAIGTRFHDKGERGNRPDRDILLDALDEVGLPLDLVDAMEITDYDHLLAEAYDTVTGLVGDQVGTPTIAVDGVAFFGPVVTPIPRGEAALRLWDGVLLVAGTDGFFEIKRTRTREPIFG